MPPIHFWGNSSSISNQFLAYSEKAVEAKNRDSEICINFVLSMYLLIVYPNVQKILPNYWRDQPRVPCCYLLNFDP